MAAAPTAADLVAFLSETAQLRAMAAATDAGRPAAEPLANALLERFGPGIREDNQKRRTGKMIRKVLEEEGFAWVRSGVATPGNPVFSKASVYRRR